MRPTQAGLIACDRPETLMLAGSAGDMIVRLFRPRDEVLGSAIVAHGRNGTADAPHMAPIIAACLARSLAVIAPNLCHSSANASAGAAATFTMGAHLSDLRQVLRWATVPERRRRAEPLLLVGHSMGAYASLRIAADAGPGEISGVLAVSPVISGRALISARSAMGADAVAALRAELPGAFEEWPEHDIEAVVADIASAAAVIVGADDTITPPSDAARLAGWLGTCVWHDVIPGEHHCPVGHAYAESVGHALDRLILR